MAFLFNLKKANAEIERLTAENAAHAARIQELTESTPEALADAEAALADANAKVADLTGQLAASKAEVTNITAERDAAKAEIETAKGEASKKAAAIVAAQGAKAIETDPGTTSNPAEQLAQITNPTERAKFIRSNKSALFQATKHQDKN